MEREDRSIFCSVHSLFEGRFLIQDIFLEGQLLLYYNTIMILMVVLWYVSMIKSEVAMWSDDVCYSGFGHKKANNSMQGCLCWSSCYVYGTLLVTLLDNNNYMHAHASAAERRCWFGLQTQERLIKFCVITPSAPESILYLLVPSFTILLCSLPRY